MVNKSYLLVALACSIASASAALRFDSQFNTQTPMGGGPKEFVPGGATWTGDGSINSSGNPIDNFNSGTLTFTGTIANNSILEAPLMMSWTISLGGDGTGRADIDVQNSGERFFIRRFTGNVTSLNMTVTYGGLVAPEDFNVSGSSGLPWGLSVGGRPGTGLAAADFRHTVGLSGLVSDPTGSNTFEYGLGANSGVNTSNLVHGGGTSTTFTRSGLTAPANSDFVKGVNYGSEPNNEQRVYMEGQTWDISIDGGDAFASDTVFRLTFDGRHYNSTYTNALSPVPEPSGALLVGLGAVLVGLRRRRRA